MNVWIITHLYPFPERPSNGFFVHESIKTLYELKHKIKVFYFIPYIPPFLLRYMPERFSLSSSNNYSLDGIDVVLIKYFPSLSKISPKIDALYKAILLRRNVRSIGGEAPDVIYAQSLYPDNPIAVRLAEEKHLPLVSIMIGSDVHTYPQKSIWIKKLIQESLPKTRKLLTVSEALLAEARKSLDISAAEVLYTACDTRRFCNMNPIRNPPRKFVFIGALVPAKGIFELIEAMYQMSIDFPDCELSIVGDGSYRRKLEDLIKEKNLSEKVHLSGFIDHERMNEVLNSADVLIFPSHREGLPNSVVEAVACERAVVVTDVGGVKEIVPDSHSFIRVPPREPSAITHAIHRILATDVHLLRQDAANGRSFAVKRFSRSINAQHLENILLNVNSPETR